MKSRAITTLVILIALGILAVVIIAFSSVTATESIARVKGGSGTVEDPLLIEVEGNAGLTPLIDSLLPFRAVPAICLSYVGEKFYVPGINEYFAGNQKLAKAIYLGTILIFIVLGLWLILRLLGKRITIVDR